MISTPDSMFFESSIPVNENFIDSPSQGESYGASARIMDYDISNLSPFTVSNHKKRMYQLATFADISKIQVQFLGLKKIISKYEMLFGCTWNSDTESPREKEFFELLDQIQSQSNVSARKYDINLIDY